MQKLVKKSNYGHVSIDTANSRKGVIMWLTSVCAAILTLKMGHN